jgi:glycosyltransferase involved in cell wall biosynthesis
LKILHIIPSLIKGGAQRMALNICQELTTCSKFDVQLVTFGTENNYSFLTKALNWKVIPSQVIPSISRESIVDVEGLQQFITNFQPDIIHSHLFETEMVLSHIKLPKKTKRIIHFHDNMVQYSHFSFGSFFKKHLITNFLEKKIVLQSYPTNTKALAISQNTFDFCKSVLPRKITVKLLHNAIDLNVFKNKHIPTYSINITIIGSLVENKGHRLAIQTIYTLKKRGLEIKLFCLGEGTERAKLEALISELELKNEVELLGNQDHPELFLQNSFCYLSTSKSEAFGLTIIEAMACGLAVVCTDGKGNRDLIQEGENGFMVWERNPKLLADKIELLLKDETLRKEMGEKAHAFAQEFGMKKYVDSLVNLYKSV